VRELGLPVVLEKIAAEQRGLILCTGTTGSGKSTSLAAMIDYINSQRTEHIITIEDPIEFLHRDKKSIVNQREVEVDTRSFAAALRSALRGDCHVHSDWSDGGSPIGEMAEAARDLGHEYMVLTDHSPRLTVANGLSAERLEEQLVEVARLNDELAPFRILTGIEVDVLGDGSLDQDPALLRRLDLVVGSVHSELRMEARPMTRRLVTALANPLLDVLGHPTGRMVTGKRHRPPSTFDAELVFAAALRFDKAIEVNARPERLDPPKRILRLAVEAGCRVAIDSDAHAPGQLAWLPYGCDRAAACGVAPASIVNAMEADRLLAWAAEHEA